MKRLIFRLAFRPVILVGEAQAWLAKKGRAGSALALMAWAPTRFVYVGLYRALCWLEA